MTVLRIFVIFSLIFGTNGQAFDFDQCLLSDTIAQHVSNWSNYTLKYIEYNQRNRGLKRSYNAAVDLCKFCYGGHVLTDTTNLPARYYPAWLGLSRKAGAGTGWEWSNGSAVAMETVHQQRLAVGTRASQSYGVVADVNKWYPVEADKILRTESADEDEDEEEREEDESATYNVARGNGNNNKPEIKGVVCQHVRRRVCEIVNYTDTVCVYSREYGCHRYVSTVIYEPDHDEPNDNCTKPKHIRFAEQCAKQSCTCHVTAWSTWSPCTAKTCMDGVGKRNRQRSILSEPPCLSHLVKPKRLSEEEECAVVGCRSLRNELFGEVEDEEEEESYQIFE